MLDEFMKDGDQSITVWLKGEERVKSCAKKKKCRVSTTWDEVMRVSTQGSAHRLYSGLFHSEKAHWHVTI